MPVQGMMVPFFLLLKVMGQLRISPEEEMVPPACILCHCHTCSCLTCSLAGKQHVSFSPQAVIARLLEQSRPEVWTAGS